MLMNPLELEGGFTCFRKGWCLMATCVLGAWRELEVASHGNAGLVILVHFDNELWFRNMEREDHIDFLHGTHDK